MFCTQNIENKTPRITSKSTHEEKSNQTSYIKCPLSLILNSHQPFFFHLHIPNLKLRTILSHLTHSNMFKSTSTRKSPSRYEKLDKEHGGSGTSNEDFKRSTSLPSRSMASTFGEMNLQRNPTKKDSSKPKEKKIHPLLSLFDFRRKKKTTARPEFARYLEYVKEGGMWDTNSNKPVIYYKWLLIPGFKLKC